MLHLFEERLIRMPYRQTENVVRRLAARRDAILAAAADAAAEGGMAAVQMAPVAARAGIAAGTVYRYFPAKTDLVAALVAAFSARELAATITTFAARALASRRLAFALSAEPVEPEVDAARAAYRQALVNEFNKLIRSAQAGGRLPEQDAALAAAALGGALIEGLVGSLAPAPPDDAAKARARVQALTLFALRGLGVVDARARGLIVQTALPQPG